VQEPCIPADEASRLATLKSLNVLDTPPEERFDRLTRLAKRMFRVPMALVSIVDENRQWFKSKDGLDAAETPRNISFCGHAILGDDIFLISNALADQRFADNPLVTGAPNIRFYAGCPLRSAGGVKVGTLCLLDDKPHEFDSDDASALRDLASMVEDELTAFQCSTTDELTRISNRRGFMELARYGLDFCARQAQPAALAFIDLDRFKPINDRFGHAIQRHVGLRAHHRLGAERHRQAGDAHHLQVVGAVAHHDRRLARLASMPSSAHTRCTVRIFSSASTMPPTTRPVSRPSPLRARWRACSPAQAFLQALGEEGEAARHQQGLQAGRLHRRQHRLRARRQAQALLVHAFQRLGRPGLPAAPRGASGFRRNRVRRASPPR
jgi:GAF domain-containing protein